MELYLCWALVTLLSKGVHIRADFLYRNFKTKTQGLIDFWLYLLFYFPGLIVFLYMTTIFRSRVYHEIRKRYGYSMDAVICGQ